MVARALTTPFVILDAPTQCACVAVAPGISHQTGAVFLLQLRDAPSPSMPESLLRAQMRRR
eukprot:8825899-Pyramimonas_sp.AAC.1